MAEGADQSEKTEDATQRKLEQARERGDVVKSQEVNTFFVLLAATLVVGGLAPAAAANLGTYLSGFLRNAAEVSFDGAGLGALFSQAGSRIGALILLPLSLIAAAGIGANLIQHRPALSFEPLKPKFSKVSPGAGFKRLFSPESLVNLGKGVVKLLLVGSVMISVLSPEVRKLGSLAATDPAHLLPIVRDLVLQLMIAVVAVLGFVAGGDYLWQRQKWLRRQKMSLQEVKDEVKQSDGDPAIKQRIRELRRKRSRQRMMSRVKEASVVVTNPTHFAVALKYETGMGAPICLAKGSDEVALRIRKIAEEKRIPIIENPPLARLLHKELEIDQEIPEAHYRAVAEVIGFVMRRRRAGSRPN